MLKSLLDVLDELNDHIERELAQAPEPVSNALMRADAPLSTLEVLRALAKAERAARSLIAPAGAPDRDGDEDRGGRPVAT